jgi:hypothetical protein
VAPIYFRRLEIFQVENNKEFLEKWIFRTADLFSRWEGNTLFLGNGFDRSPMRQVNNEMIGHQRPVF